MISIQRVHFMHHCTKIMAHQTPLILSHFQHQPNPTCKHLDEHIDETSNVAIPRPFLPIHASPGCNVNIPDVFHNPAHYGFGVRQLLLHCSTYLHPWLSPKTAVAKKLILFFLVLIDSSIHLVLIPRHIV